MAENCGISTVLLLVALALAGAHTLYPHSHGHACALQTRMASLTGRSELKSSAPCASSSGPLQLSAKGAKSTTPVVDVLIDYSSAWTYSMKLKQELKAESFSCSLFRLY